MVKRRKHLHKFVVLSIFLLFFLIVTTIVKINRQRIYERSNGEIVVLFEEEISWDDLTQMISNIDESAKVKSYLGDYALIEVEKEEYFHFLKRVKKDSRIAAVQTNDEIQITGYTNDAYTDVQWAIHNPGQYLYFTDKDVVLRSAKEDLDMDVDLAWQELEKKGLVKREVVVAIIDTGVDYSHPDLAQNMWINEGEIDKDGIDNDNNGYVDDIYGWDFYNDDASICHYKYDEASGLNLSLPEDKDDHGTHIAGIIGAVANNHIGIAGIASYANVKIMPLKVNGGKKGTGNISSAIEAIKYATMMGAEICNMSWGTTKYSEVLYKVIKESDMLFVAAAGNSGTNNGVKPVYPASFELDNVISVTFVNPYGELSDLANYGTASVDLAAPGEDIFSTIVGNYAFMSGSSMATPHVSAVAALIYSSYENIYPANVKELICNNIKPISNLKGYMAYPGIPNAYHTLVMSSQLLRDEEAPELKFETLYDQKDFLVLIDAIDPGGSGLRTLKYIKGERKIHEFHRGVSGAEITDGFLRVSGAGIYTFYAADYAGNEMIKTYEILEDLEGPEIIATYSVSDDYKTRTISIRVKDDKSGIRRVEFLKGKKEPTDFLPATVGTVIELKDGKASFDVTEDGFYSIFASDHRGNLAVKLLEVNVVKATGLRFPRLQKTLYAGEQKMLYTYIKPINTTDRIYYSSSNENIVTVSKSGKITAKEEGIAYVYARTPSGLSVRCKIIVIRKMP